MKIISLDPAAGLAGVSCMEIVNEKINIIWTFTIKSVEEWNVDMQNAFVAHSFASIVMIEKPQAIVSEKPWGMGFSKESLSQLIGMLKVYHLKDITWQTITHARKTVLNTGSADKLQSAESLLKYPFTKKSQNTIKKLIENAKITNQFDELDATLHGLAFFINQGLIKKESV